MAPVQSQVTENRRRVIDTSAIEARVRATWTGKSGLGLGIASTLYGLGHDARNLLYDVGILETWAMPIPVVSVGGLTTGGSGKTPVTAAIAGWLVEGRRRPSVITGGIPDEAAVHRMLNPDLTVVDSRNRRVAIRMAMRSGAGVAVLDSGFQHRRVRSDLQILCVDLLSALLPGRRRLPAGPFRERWSALARADAVILVRRGEGTATARAAEVRSVLAEVSRVAPRALAGSCVLRPGMLRAANARAENMPTTGRPVAVAGVMWPARFFDALDQLGIPVAGRLAFRDHEPYGPRQLDRIRENAADGIVCTLKDAVKLGPLLANDVPVWYLEEEVVWESGERRLRDGVLQIACVRPPLRQIDSVQGDGT